jgi:hypothetical protein
MILPEFCKADALQTIQETELILNTLTDTNFDRLTPRIAYLLSFLKAAHAAAPLIPQRTTRSTASIPPQKGEQTYDHRNN